MTKEESLAYASANSQVLFEAGGVIGAGLANAETVRLASRVVKLKPLTSTGMVVIMDTMVCKFNINNETRSIWSDSK